MATPPSHVQALLPDEKILSLESIQESEGRVLVHAKTTKKKGRCPVCGRISRSVHSHYFRRLRDLPWHGAMVEMRVRVRRFRCQNSACRRRIFAEPIPTAAPHHAQHTARLTEVLQLVSYMLGGNPGERLCSRLGVEVSADTILRRLEAQTDKAAESVRVLGVDDWAWRRGQRYGTVLVDLQQHRVVEVLPDRSADTVKSWLMLHPEIEVISRDRAGAYAQAATEGAPDAVQVADRFHLICNLSSAIERVLEPRMPQIRNVFQYEDPEPESLQGVATTTAENRKDARRQHRLDRYNKVIEMFGSGMSQAEICRGTGMEKKTVRRFLRTGAFPERAASPPRTKQVEEFREYLLDRWSKGCHNATQLWREIKGKGYQGGRSMVAQYSSKLRSKGTKYFRKTAKRNRLTVSISTKSLAILFTKPAEALEPEDHNILSKILTQCGELIEVRQLGCEFKRALQLRSGAAMTAWIAHASQSSFAAMSRFARGLRRDEAAVTAAASLSWSNGQVEGQVHRLKLIKRQMYGRGGFQLLRRRVLPYQKHQLFPSGYRSP